MTARTSTGIIFAGLYALLCSILIATQGLFGESFIAILLGLPLSMVLASIEFGNVSGILLYVLVLLPIVINAFALYWLGYFVGQYKMIRLPLIILGVLGLLVGGFFAFNSYIYNEKQGNGEVVEPYRGTLSGEVVCLPHKDTSGPITLECAIGMRTDVGEHYVLDMTLLSQENPPLDTGDRFTANGLITPIERLSTDQWNKYDVVGVFSVTDSLQKF